MVRGKTAAAGQGPTIRGSDPWIASAGKYHQRLARKSALGSPLSPLLSVSKKALKSIGKGAAQTRCSISSTGL
jgi:hypothetical protein